MAEFDPNSSIDNLNAHLEQHPEDLQAVLKAEKDGKNRSTFVTDLEERIKATPETTAGQAVNVQAAAPTAEGTGPGDRRNIGGNDYSVTSDRGHRLSKS